MISKEALFRQSAEEIGEEDLMIVHFRYGLNPNPEYRYRYHQEDHSKTVAERTRHILEAAEVAVPGLVNPRRAILAIMNGNGHDVKIEWVEEIKKINGVDVVQMKRNIGTNEQDSANEQKQLMRKKNEQYGEEIFEVTDYDSTDEDILVTVPGYSSELQTVFQPNLNPNTSIESRAVALADLGSAGMNHERYMVDGDRLLIEEKLYLARSLIQLTEPLTDFQRDVIRSIISDWSHSQVPFALGRAKATVMELAPLPKPAQRGILRLFPDFQLSADEALAKANDRDEMGFLELVTDVGLLDPRKNPRAHLINTAFL